jgi:hypothetical protein
MPIPNPWVIIGAIGFWFASCVGVYFWAQGIEADQWKAAYAAQAVEASNKLAASEKRKSDADNANIIATLELQDAYEKRIKALEDNSAGSNDRIAASVRRIAARCGGGGGNPVPGETPNPVSVPSVPGGSREELLKRIGSDFDALGKSADRLKEKFRACFDWAHQHGR